MQLIRQKERIKMIKPVRKFFSKKTIVIIRCGLIGASNNGEAEGKCKNQQVSKFKKGDVDILWWLLA